METKALTFEEVKSIPKVHFNQQVVLFLDHLTIGENIAGISRLADAFQVDTLILYHCVLKNPKKINRMSRSTFEKHTIIYSDSFEELQKDYKDFHWVGLEWTNNSIPVADFHNESKVLLVLGSEKHGISEEVLNQIKTCIHIDMFGANSSMNVACATGIALYQIRQNEINE